MDFKEIFNNKPRCQHFHEDGSRCKADPQTNNKFCFMHDPEQKEKQAEARRRGGQARFQPWERKVPPNLKYLPLADDSQVDAFIDQIILAYIEDQIDLRSARFLIFAVNGKLARWNAKNLRQYRAVKSVENQARILARESDPWSPAHGVLARTAKAKEEAAKAVGNNQSSPYEVHPKIAAAVDCYPSTMNEEGLVPGTKVLPTNPRRQELEQCSKPSAMPSDVALSFRELDELEKEEERKEQERAAARKKLSQGSQKENQESEAPENGANDSTQASEPAPAKRPPQPVPPAPASRGASSGPAQTAQPARPATYYNLSEAEMERLRDDIWIESARKVKPSRRRSRQTWKTWK